MPATTFLRKLRHGVLQWPFVGFLRRERAWSGMGSPVGFICMYIWCCMVAFMFAQVQNCVDIAMGGRRVCVEHEKQEGCRL